MTYEDDWAWQERFNAHASEIIRDYVRDRFAAEIDRSSSEDDWKRNTDGFLRFTRPLPENARLSQRVRRVKHRRRYGAEQTIRLDRPYAQAEMPKLVAGFGDIELYGFGPDDELGAAGPPLRFTQWFLGDLNVLRDALARGVYLTPAQKNTDRGEFSSRYTSVNVHDLPPEYVLASYGLPEAEPDWDGWYSCRNPDWKKRHPMCGGPLHPRKLPAGGYAQQFEDNDDTFRQCLSCGFKWRVVASYAQTLRVQRSRRVLGALYPAANA